MEFVCKNNKNKADTVKVRRGVSVVVGPHKTVNVESDAIGSLPKTFSIVGVKGEVSNPRKVERSVEPVKAENKVVKSVDKVEMKDEEEPTEEEENSEVEEEKPVSKKTKRGKKSRRRKES